MASFDVVVVGGGVSGVCCAIQAARLGAKTALLETEQVLGGNSSALLGVHILGAAVHGQRPWGQETGIIEELELEALHAGAFLEPPEGAAYFTALWSEILRRKCLESGVHLFLRTVGLSAERKGFRVVQVKAFDLARHEPVEFEVKHILVDASGDGHVAASAGCSWRYGREGRAEFGELFAPEEADTNIAGASLIYWVENTGRPVDYQALPGVPEYASEQELPYGKVDLWKDGRAVGVSWATEWGGHLDTLKDNDKIYAALVDQVLGLVDFAKHKAEGKEAFANYKLLWLSPRLGKRESRRFIGDYTLTQHDLYAQERLPDRVAYGGFPIDQHESAPDPDKPRIIYYDIPPLYDIPLRALYSKDVDNVMLAGRLISGTHVAHGSYRVMKTGGAIGQAVGACAALCSAYKLTPRAIARLHIEELQQLLLREDATILDLANEDREDVARGAKVTASWESPEHPADNVTDGVHRQFAEQPSHKWVGEGLFPQYLTVHFAKPQVVGAVQLTFDTKLRDYRGVNLQPAAFGQTPRAYRLWVVKGGQGKLVAEVDSNYQRMRRHSFEPLEAEQLVLEIDATNGAEWAGVYEIRAWRQLPLL